MNESFHRASAATCSPAHGGPKGEGGSDHAPLSPLSSLSERDIDALAVIAAFIRAHGRGPSFSELACKLGFHKTAAQRAIERLIAKGFLARVPISAKNIRITTLALSSRAVTGFQGAA